MAELLLAHGAVPDARSSDGRTPLDLAKDVGDAAMVEVLSAAGGRA